MDLVSVDMKDAILLSATLLLVVFTLLPLWRREIWVVRVLDFPRLQLAVVALLLGITGIIILDLSRYLSWLTIAPATLCLFYHSLWIIPYTKLHPVEVKAAKSGEKKHRLRIMTANVLGTNRNSEGLLKIIRLNEPDILVTLESNHWWQSRLEELEVDYPYSKKCALENLYGMHVYSKFELIDSEIKYLVEPDIPSIHTLVKLPSEQNVRMHFLHPKPPVPENNGASERDAELIIVAKSVAKTDCPVIVTGDLNDVAWSENTRLFRKISGSLDPRIGRGMFNTYHADYPFMRWPLDHLFHSSHFTLSSMKRLEKFGSDHFPLLIELVCEPAEKSQQTSLDTDQEDRHRANEKVSEENVDEDDVPSPDNR